jgi:hypothetical protein
MWLRRRPPRRCLRRVWSRLAARAVIGGSGIYAVSLYTADHPRSATAARFPVPLVHPVLLTAGQLPGGGLLGTVGVQYEKPPGQRHHGVGIDFAQHVPQPSRRRRGTAPSARGPPSHTHCRVAAGRVLHRWHQIRARSSRFAGRATGRLGRCDASPHAVNGRSGRCGRRLNLHGSVALSVGGRFSPMML